MPIKPTPKKNNRIKVKTTWNSTDFNYASTKWIGLRNTFRFTYPLCQECEKKGLIKPMKIVDHIKPISKGGEPFDWDNLQSLCETCHNRKTAIENK
jgi:5-methylcytosine-specific restriction protein A